MRECTEICCILFVNSCPEFWAFNFSLFQRMRLSAEKKEKQKNSNTQCRPSDIIDLISELSKLFHQKSQLPLFWKEEKGIQDLDEIKNSTLDLVTPTEKDEKTPLDDQRCPNAAQINCVSKTFFCSLKELNWKAICDREQRKIFIRNAKWTSYENILIKKMIFVVRIFIGFSINYADQIQTEKNEAANAIDSDALNNFKGKMVRYLSSNTKQNNLIGKQLIVWSVLCCESSRKK